MTFMCNAKKRVELKVSMLCLNFGAFFLDSRMSPSDDKKYYYGELANQVNQKSQTQYAKAKMDEEQQMRHFQHWDTYWGRPGYGAPRQQGPQKENLMKILHYPQSKSPTNVELITLERLPIKP